MIDNLTNFFGYGTLLVHVGLIFFSFLIIFKKDKLLNQFLREYGLYLATFFAVLFSLSSLSLSIILKLEPCSLCWYQRVFMFSSAVILVVILIKKDFKALLYPYILCVLGTVIAVYHYIIQMLDNLGNSALTGTCAIGGTIDCAINYFVFFNYITISMMSLTSFLTVIIFIKYAQHKYKTSY